MRDETIGEMEVSEIRVREVKRMSTVTKNDSENNDFAPRVMNMLLKPLISSSGLHP